MKRFIPILLTIVLMPILTSSSAKTDDNDHRLVKLWQNYNKAISKDLPKDAAAALEAIKTEAAQKRYAWDFYDAAEKLAEVRTRSNWKLRDSLLTQFRSDVTAFGEPAAIYYMRRGENDSDLRDFLLENESKLKRSSHPEFWKRDWMLGQYKFSQALEPLIKNDWDYCLWSLFPKDEMSSEYTSYPMNAFVDYQSISWSDRKANLEAYLQKYQGKAAALMAKEDLLQMKFERMDGQPSLLRQDGQAPSVQERSEQFKALRKEAVALQDEAKAFKGSEKEIAECCIQAEWLIDRLDSKDIICELKDSRLDMKLRNLKRVTVEIFKTEEGKKTKVWNGKVENPVGSYYERDSVSLTLPDLGDGTWTIEVFDPSGPKDERVQEFVQWEKYTISAASRWNEDGLGIWAADFRTGEPLQKVDVDCMKDDKVVRTISGFALDGFTTLPSDFTAELTGGDRYSHYLRIRTGNRSSKTIWPGSYSSPILRDDAKRLNCVILTDRSAFQPDETVEFKAILYRGAHSIAPAPGESVKVSLLDPQGKVLEEQLHSSSPLGSIAGSFVLRRSERGGRYMIMVKAGEKTVGSKYVLVDDFVLPTFDLSFDKMDDLDPTQKEITVKGSVKAYSGHSLSGAAISYSVYHNGDEHAAGQPVLDGERFEFTFPVDSTENARWGSSYSVTVKVTDVTGETMEFQKWIYLNSRREPEKPTEYFFEECKEGIGVKITAGSAKTWAVAELYGLGNKLLSRKLICFAPDGNGPATATVHYDYAKDMPETVCLNILYFQNCQAYSYSHSVRREDHTYDMPLSFERFLDTTAPGARYTFTLRTMAGAEVAASVFDKSTERFMGNGWTTVRPEEYPFPYIDFRNEPGCDIGHQRVYGIRKRANGVMLMSKAAAKVMTDAVEEECMMVEDNSAAPTAAAVEEGIIIRENFANTIAWEPYLKADKNGKVEFSFTNSDKLSTYCVQLFAHDASMRNATVRKEMVVSIPVKISLVEPKFLYDGDSWTVRVGLSSSLKNDVQGRLSISFLNGNDYRKSPVLSGSGKTVTVAGNGSCSVDFPLAAKNIDETLGILISFKPSSSDLGSDGVFVTVPVKKAVQTLTEAHSAVLRPGDNRLLLETDLRASFVNVPGSAAQMRDISILNMIKEAIPEAIEPDSDNAIALSEALYAAALCERLGVKVDFDKEKAAAKLLDLQDKDGGFAWFKGMTPSSIVTATVLTRLHGLEIIDEEEAVRFMDKQYFDHDASRWWCCGLTLGQYLYVRSLFPEVPFTQNTKREFRKEARAYLIPRGDRGLSGMVFAKARRLRTLDNLTTLEGGTALAHKMGIKLFAAKKMNKSIEADVASLVQYAEPHKHGGTYFPNAVMPWRGLLESELYAHSIICSLMQTHGHGDIADGIRLWMMLQKETQHWENDPGYIEAIACVMDASQEVLDTRVLALKATYTKPLSEIVAGGNGMSIARGEPTELKVGDRIQISWNITNEENRSHVHITLPHSAGLVPVNQVSGYHRGCYRSVFADRIELWYETYPEEKTTISEYYYVTRSGSFQCAAAEIECLYAPHYRANSVAPDIQIIK